MGSRIESALCLALLAIIATAASAADREEPAFNIHLEGVKIDYPGTEHWAEVERPDGKHLWAFAIYTGKKAWTVRFPADAPGAYRLLRVEGRQGEKHFEESVATNSQCDLRVQPDQTIRPHSPVQPNLVEAGEFKTFFAAEEPWCLNDHTFVQGPDKTWHLFAITHPKPLDFFKDPGRRLAHATAPSLQGPWAAQPPAVTRDWERYREYLLWAPYVLRYQDSYYMFVCVGDKDTHHYRIHLLTSRDLKEWTRSPANPVLVDGFDARDPMVMRAGDQWVLYYAATTAPDGGNHIVACVTSKDLVHWGNRTVAFIHPRAGSFGGPTESPFVVRRGDRYFLFVCNDDWTDVYVSDDPFHWDFDQMTTRVRAHAAEIVRDGDGRWYISHAGWMAGPLKIAPLHWNDGLQDPPTNILPAEK